MISVCKTAIENQISCHFKSISFNYLRPCREILKEISPNFWTSELSSLQKYQLKVIRKSIYKETLVFPCIQIRIKSLEIIICSWQ